MIRLKLIFMGTPEFAVPALAALLEAGHEVAAVYSQPPRPAGRGQKEQPSAVHAYARAQGIPVHTPVSLKSPEAQEIFRSHGADAAVVAAYGLLLPAPILEAPRLGCLNIHPSLLPRWRGAAPIPRTLMAGDAETALCIMQMDEGLDTGPVWLCEKLPLSGTETAGALHDTLSVLGGKMMVQALELAASGKSRPTPQPAEGATYAKKIDKAEARLDWHKTANKLERHIRGLNPFPGAYFEFRGEKFKVWGAEALPSLPPMEKNIRAPGTALDERLTILCGDGSILRLLEIQRQGKKSMPAGELLRGFPIPSGTSLV